jgi:CRP-like cAMP-binding protein
MSKISGKVLPLEVRSELHAVATPVRKEKGAILFRAGQPGRGAFLIRSGKVRLTLDVASGLYPPRTVSSGAVIGLPATFSGEPYSLTAEVEKTCRMDFIPRRRLLNLLLRNPKTGFQIVRILSEEIFQMRRAAKRSISSGALTTKKAWL